MLGSTPTAASHEASGTPRWITPDRHQPRSRWRGARGNQNSRRCEAPSTKSGWITRPLPEANRARYGPYVGSGPNGRRSGTHGTALGTPRRQKRSDCRRNRARSVPTPSDASGCRRNNAGSRNPTAAGREAVGKWNRLGQKRQSPVTERLATEPGSGQQPDPPVAGRLAKRTRLIQKPPDTSREAADQTNHAESTTARR